MEKKDKKSVSIKSLKITEHFLFSPCDIAFSEPNGKLGSGINYIVGESGSGKTRLLEILTGKRMSMRQNTPGQQPTDVPLILFYNNEVTKAVFEVLIPPNPIILAPDSTMKTPTSGKNVYLSNSHIGPQGEVVAHKRKGKNGKEYSIDKNSLGTGEFSYDYLQETFKSASVSSEQEVYVIEEPEYAKDPITQARLMKEIAEAAKIHQIFITTHSPSIIDWNYINSGASIIKLSRTGEETVIGSFKGKVPEFLIKTTKAHLGGTESKSFLFANKVCVVEGQEDVGYLQVYFGGDLHDGQFSNPEFVFFGYGVNGQGNINAILDICASLKIPKVAAIFDGDPSKETEESYNKAATNPDYKILGYKVIRLLAPDIRNKINKEDEVDGVFKRSDGSCVEFSKNEKFKQDFETNLKGVFDYFSS